jgi:NADH-quinone oxidoreductase subunit E
MAPVVVVDDEVEGKVTPTRVDGIMLALQDQEKKAEKDQNSRQEEGETL